MIHVWYVSLFQVNKHRPLLSYDDFKIKILSRSYLLHSKSPYYEDIYVSIDKTKAEQAKHKLLVEELRAQGKQTSSYVGTALLLNSIP